MYGEDVRPAAGADVGAGAGAGAGAVVWSVVEDCFRSRGTDDVEEVCRIVAGLLFLLRRGVTVVEAAAAAAAEVVVGVADVAAVAEWLAAWFPCAGSATSARPPMDRLPSPFDAMTAAVLAIMLWFLSSLS